MEQATAVWFIIVLALVTANLPFALERPLLVLPWTQAGRPGRPSWLLGLESLAFFIVLAALAYFVRPFIGTAVFSGADPVSVLLFMARLLAVFAAAFLLLSYAGWGGRRAGGRLSGARNASRGASGGAKPFFSRLLELLALYVLVGMLGFGFERNIGNAFMQGWEFYVITLCLFVVLGYPGFVYRYLLRGRGRRN